MDNILVPALSQTRKVLIGLGEEWFYDYKNISNDIEYKNLLEKACLDHEWLVPFIQYHYMKNHDDSRTRAFTKLADLIKDKDYFIVIKIIFLILQGWSFHAVILNICSRSKVETVNSSR